MKIQVYRFSIPFKNEIIFNNIHLQNRLGLIISIALNDQVGIGEASPLETFSKETLSDIVWKLEGLSPELQNCSINDARELAKIHLEGTPSAAFAFDTAIYDLESKLNNQPFRFFINDQALSLINVSSLDNVNSISSNKSIKVKVSEKNLFSLVEKIEMICKKLEKGSKLRIDFNGQMNLTKAIRFVKEIRHLKDRIEYIEQPLLNDQNCLEDTSELRLHSDIPIALDESASNIKSIKRIIDYAAADVIILKPMQCGFFLDIFKIKKLADDAEINIVFSSMYDGPIAFQSSLNIACALRIDSFCGYDTIKFFKNENLFPSEIHNGCIKLISKIGLGLELGDLEETIVYG